MFEKETEEYYETETPMIENITGLDFQNEITKAFQKGAEFGYKKANEWHYPSKGEYPKDEKKVLVLLKDVEEPILDYYRQDRLWNYALKDEVIAWKEIILL